MNRNRKNFYRNHLFNFSSSYMGGGLKRLMAFVEWFDRNGGAQFIVNGRLQGNLDNFPHNIYHYVTENKFKKFVSNQDYVDQIIQHMTYCNLYYSYNIPVNKNTAQLTWFHLSNVLPFLPTSNMQIPLLRRVELWWLGRLIRSGLVNCDFVSAESEYSLGLLNLKNNTQTQISVNGSDQELNLMEQNIAGGVYENYAVIVGTYHHKNLSDSYKVFRELKKNNPGIKLLIVGDASTIPLQIKRDQSVELKGVLDYENTIKILSKSKFYINTSKVENSWNAASEGALLANESFVSKIPPHDELLQDSKTKVIRNLGTFNPIINIERRNLNINKLISWEDVIELMNKKIELHLKL